MPILFVVNVRHGNSAVLVDKKGTIIFDAGRRNELLEFLLSKQIYQIDILLLSHADADHIGGAMALINSQKFDIKAVYINSDSIKDTDIFKDLIFSLFNNPKITLEPSITPNLNGKLDQGDIQIEVLGPNTYMATMAAGGKDIKQRKITSNSISAVFRLKYKDKNIALLPGDIDSVGLENLIDDKKELNAWLLIFPHHGGTPGNKKIVEFVEKICELTNAELIIFSIDDNEDDYPQIEIVNCISQKLANATMLTTGSSNIFQFFIDNNPGCTHKNGVGNIEIDFDDDPLTIKTMYKL